MPYKIIDEDPVVEVHVTGDATTAEVLEALRKLQENDPRKERSDLWHFASESVLPYDVFPMIVESIKRACTRDMVGRPSAIVTSDKMLSATLDIYKQEAKASKVPFEIRVFTDRETALKWLGN